jgi:FkbM family methyltransferase
MPGDCLALHSVGRVLRAVNLWNPGVRGRNLVAMCGRKILRGRALEVRVSANVTMALNLDEYIEGHIFFAAYEVLSTRLVLKSLRPGGMFIDIGANVGYYSLLAKSRVGRRGRVMAFEPNPEIAARLRKNMDLSSVGEIEIHEAALSDVPGTAAFVCPRNGSHGWGSLVAQPGWDGQIIAVETAVLDEIVPENVIVDAIKLDIEGAEYLALRGARETIRRCRPYILMEINAAVSEAFQVDRLAALDLLLSLHPYKIQTVTSHEIRDASFQEVRNCGIASLNVFLTP